MKALEKALHCLRPLVEAEKWDYLVVWECGDDPSRFIQWVGCCCSNAHGICENIKKEKIDKTKVGLCRDTFLKHFAKYEACLELEKFPLFIPLYSGLHGETVLSIEATWLGSCDKDLCLNLFHEAVNVSLSNLLSYPFVREAVQKKHLLLKGAHYNFIDCSLESWTLEYGATHSTRHI